MRKRYSHEPKRDAHGIPTCKLEELESDPGDPLRPAYTYLCTHDGGMNAVEPHAPAAQFGQPDHFTLRTDIFAGSPYTVVLVFADEERAYDVRVAEAASITRRFTGVPGTAFLVRDQPLLRPTYRRGKSIVEIEHSDSPVGVLIWPNHALNRSQLEEILASPGGFFRHLRTCVLKPRWFSGTTNTTTGRIT